MIYSWKIHKNISWNLGVNKVKSGLLEYKTILIRNNICKGGTIKNLSFIWIIANKMDHSKNAKLWISRFKEWSKKLKKYKNC